MSRSYRTLALALLGVLVIVGLAQVATGHDGKEPPAAGPVSTDAVGTDGVPPGTDPSATASAQPTDSAGSQVATDEADGTAPEAPTSTAAPAPGDCTVTESMQLGASGDQVACLQSQLAKAGFTVSSPNGAFDDATDRAVRAFQQSKSLEVDGIAGRKTAQSLGIWGGPTGPQPATDGDCPDTAHGAIVDRANQRGALCERGAITYQFPITSAWSQPDPGVYPVYAKDLNASSTFGGHYSTMTHFVAFTRGKYKGARVAFHSVPKLPSGEWVMPLDGVGTEQYHGQSSGCIRVLPDDAVKIWDWLGQGDKVHVIS
ncbi:MAG: L,D-transpeptidase family protein [Ilumatobacteraceae bacterium]